MACWTTRLCLLGLASIFANAVQVQHAKRSDKIAFMTFLANDPHEGKLAKLDGAGVLAQSIQTHMGHLNYEMLAVVTPGVVTSRPILEKFGYKIVEYEEPDIHKIRNPSFAQEVVSDGCCGPSEMLKLMAYKMTDYDRLFVMDTDTLVHGSFEELLSRPETTLYTAPFAEKEGEQLQGSFLVIKPNPEMYDEIMDTWYAGEFGGDGWNHSGIGYSYGGRTVQGILPYFLKKVHPETSAEIDHCIYNNNGDERGGYCEGRDPSEAKMNHFTVCQKPWYCRYPNNGGPCSKFTHAWWNTYDQLAAKLQNTGETVVEHEPCNDYTDGMSASYPPLLPEVGPSTPGW